VQRPSPSLSPSPSLPPPPPSSTLPPCLPPARPPVLPPAHARLPNLAPSLAPTPAAHLLCGVAHRTDSEARSGRESDPAAYFSHTATRPHHGIARSRSTSWHSQISFTIADHCTAWYRRFRMVSKILAQCYEADLSFDRTSRSVVEAGRNGVCDSLGSTLKFHPTIR
jgi:hypothetical protein